MCSTLNCFLHITISTEVIGNFRQLMHRREEEYSWL
nr:unnamed protein product [Callosobruchus chinensis]CAH7763457.1 unnamed protein product [Callosobruchus chinensis]